MADSPRQPTESQFEPTTTALLGATFAVLGVAAALWLGGEVAAVVSGHGAPPATLTVGLRTLAQPGDPARAWRAPMPSPMVYWTATALTLIALTAAILIALTWWRRDTSRRASDPRHTPGLADRHQIAQAASRTSVLRRAAHVRPTLAQARPHDIGYRLGHTQGADVWASIEDSIVVLGPPRSGKGLHLVVPTILDSPGAVITTATRPDNLALTMNARRRRGPVAVFDPQRLAAGVASATKWSPIRGCEDPQTAMIRARALAAGTGEHVDNGLFWQAQTESALRAFLHAAALAGRGAADLYRWSLDPVAAGEAARILNASGGAVGWADALESIIHGDPRTRDNAWAGIRISMSSLADPRVLDAVSPGDSAEFDPAEFLAEHGTLYLLGTATGAGSTSGLVAALIEDIVEVARQTAAASAGARLDPPLALLLDEAANYVLPSLPALVSEGGGTGITTVAVLQSLAQARARWGEHEASTIWDASIVKIILGGGSNAKDLQDLAALIGDRDEQITSESRDPRGQRSTSTSVRRVPILDAGTLRTLPFGTGVLLLRSARPVILDLDAWPARSDAADLAADRGETEALIRTAQRKARSVQRST